MQRERCLIVKGEYTSATNELFSQLICITRKKQSSKIEARRLILPVVNVVASPSPTGDLREYLAG